MRTTIFALALLLAVTALAQPNPDRPADGGGGDRPQPGNPPPMPMVNFFAMNVMPAMELTPQGLFIVNAATLVKLDPATLETKGTAVLLGPLPVMKDAGGQVDMRRWQQEVQARQASPAMLANGEMLIVILGDRFFRVNQRTLVVEAKASLTEERPNPEAQPMPNSPVLLKLNGDVLYVVRAPQALAINPVNGDVLARGKVPMPQPIALPAGQFGREPMNPDRGKDGRNPAAGVDAAPIVVVGVVKHIDLEGGFWTIKDDQGNEYVLQGDRARELTAIPQLDAKRVRIEGQLTRGPGNAMVGKGYLTVQKFEVLK